MLNAYQSLNKSEFEPKIKGAETGHSMGLLNEAFSSCQRALSLIPVEEKKSLNIIQNKIDQIQKELANMEDSDSQEISSDDVVTIKNSLTHDDDAASMIDKAIALNELGLIKDAVDEVQNIFLICHILSYLKNF